MNPLKCKQLQTENKKLQQRIAYLEKQNTIQAMNMLASEDLFERERESHLLTLYTVQGMAEVCGTIGEFKANWSNHLEYGLDSVKYATRDEQNEYLKQWGVELITEEVI